MDAIFTRRRMAVSDWNLLKTTTSSCVVIKEEHLLTNWINRKTELRVSGKSEQPVCQIRYCTPVQYEPVIMWVTFTMYKWTETKHDLAKCIRFCSKAANARFLSVIVSCDTADERRGRPSWSEWLQTASQRKLSSLVVLICTYGFWLKQEVALLEIKHAPSDTILRYTWAPGKVRRNLILQREKKGWRKLRKDGRRN
jgi:hypothetical protein